MAALKGEYREMRTIMAACAVIGLAAGALAAEDDFNFSWEDDRAAADTGADHRVVAESTAISSGKGAAEAADDTMAAETKDVDAETDDKSFQDWSWKKPKGSKPGAAAESNAGSYEALVKKNLDLRRGQDELAVELEEMREQNASLKRQVAGVEAKRRNMAEMLSDLEAQPKQSAGDQEKVKSLQRELARLRSEHVSLAEAKSRLNAEVADMKRQQATTTAGSPASGAAAGVQPGSDLFRELQKERAEIQRQKKALQDETAALGTARSEEMQARQSFQARENQLQGESKAIAHVVASLKRQLSEEQAARKEERRVLGKIYKNSTQMESRIENLQQELAEKDAELKNKQDDMAVVREEIRRRDWRFSRAERLNDHIARARAEVQRAANQEKRDMHYNMGIMYTEKGLHVVAMHAYLQALRLDPFDPDIHYNLAILYDDHMGLPDKAVAHYTRYLQLKPGADDADQVRTWMLELELAIQED